jgi:hypothetical protein
MGTPNPRESAPPRISGHDKPRRRLALTAAIAVLASAWWAAPAPASAAAAAYPSPAKTAKDVAHQRSLQQQRYAGHAAAAAKAAAQFARAARITKALWVKDGQPPLLTVVTLHKVYILSDGVLQLALPHPTGPLSVLWLAQNLPDQWVSWPAPGVARLNSALAITGGASVSTAVGDLSTLQLADHTWIRVTRGSFAVTGTALTSFDPTANGPLAPTDPDRPYLRAGRGATLSLDGTTVTGLGNASAPDDSGIVWGKGATGHATAVKVVGGYAGLRLAGSSGVALKQVTATGSVKDGLVLENDTGTTLNAVTSRQNGGHGVRVGRGPANRTLSGLTTSENHGFGLAAANLSGLTVDHLTSTGDEAGGIELTGCTSCAVVDATTKGYPVGVKISRASSHVTVTRGVFNAAGYGVFVGAQADGVTLNGITVSSSGAYGVDISGRDVAIVGGSIDSRGTGVRVGPTAARISVTGAAIHGGARAGIAISGDDVTVSRSTVQGGGEGVKIYLKPRTVVLDTVAVNGARDSITIAKGATGVRIRNCALSGFAHYAIANSSPGLVVLNGTLRGGGTGVHTQASMSLTGTRIDQVTEGLHVGSGGNLDAHGIDVLAEKTGASVAARGLLVLEDSTVLAPIGVTGHVRFAGHNVVAPPPFPWLGAAAIAAILLGFILEALHATRQPKRRPTREVAPRHVRNVA